MRQEYEMTEAELATLLDACKPVPYMVVGGVMPRTPGQNANDAWRALAAKRGFVWDTVQPVAVSQSRSLRASRGSSSRAVDVHTESLPSLVNSNCTVPILRRGREL